jgi:tripartite-type tricarboxylate transporter receptor subunit TctC
MAFTRRDFLQSAAASVLIAGSPAARAQNIELARVLGGFSPGGSVDTLSRRLADKLRPGYAKAVVAEPRPGAGGQLAITVLKSSTPDGKIMLVTPMSMLSIYPHIFRKLPYDPFADLTPVSVIADFEFGFGVGPAVPAEVKTVPQFLAWAKENPKQANFGSPGAGSSTHFIGLLLGREHGVALTHVPYRGSQPAIQDLTGGQLPALSAPLGEFLPHLSGNRVRLLGSSGAKRNVFVPGVPTFTEQGFKDMVYGESFCLYLPPGAKQDVVERLNQAVKTAMASSDVAAGLAQMAIVPTSSTPAALAALQKAEHSRWEPLVQSIGFTAES